MLKPQAITCLPLSPIRIILPSWVRVILASWSFCAAALGTQGTRIAARARAAPTTWRASSDGGCSLHASMHAARTRRLHPDVTPAGACAAAGRGHHAPPPIRRCPHAHACPQAPHQTQPCRIGEHLARAHWARLRPPALRNDMRRSCPAPDLSRRPMPQWVCSRVLAPPPAPARATAPHLLLLPRGASLEPPLSRRPDSFPKHHIYRLGSTAHMHVASTRQPSDLCRCPSRPPPSPPSPLLP